ALALLLIFQRLEFCEPRDFHIRVVLLLLLRLLDLLARISLRLRLIVDMRRDSVAALEQHGNDFIDRAPLLEQRIDHKPDRARSIAAEVLTAPVLDQAIEIALVRLGSRAIAARLSLLFLCAFQLRERFID